MLVAFYSFTWPLFYVIKMRFGTYKETTKKSLLSLEDINAQVTKATALPLGELIVIRQRHVTIFLVFNWNIYMLKDTLIVPTGGYVVIRFIANSPGAWFFHCHIDLYNTIRMGMFLLEFKVKWPYSNRCFNYIFKYTCTYFLFVSLRHYY